MIHREYKLTVAIDILEYAGMEVNPVHYRVGHVLTVDQDIWDRLKKGETIERPASWGIIRYDKKNFANEVQWTEVTINYGTAKLGLRNC